LGIIEEATIRLTAVFKKQTCPELEIKFFAGIGAFFCPGKEAFSKKKGLRRIRRAFLSQKQAFSKKKVFAELGAFFCPKNGSGYKSQGGQKSPRRGAKISPGGAAAPLLPALMIQKILFVCIFSFLHLKPDFGYLSLSLSVEPQINLQLTGKTSLAFAFRIQP